MAKVTFRRGESSLYKERWYDYNINGNQEYAYLNNAIYFANDTQEIYMNGDNYTFDKSIDLTNVMTEVEYDSVNNTLTFDYSDINKSSKTIYLQKIMLKDEDGPLTLDVNISDSGQRIYQIGMKDISDIPIKGITSIEENIIIENGDSFSTAFSKINNSISLIDIPDDEED